MRSPVKAKLVKLSPTQIQFYDDFGYLAVPGMFDAESCEEMIAVAEALSEGDYSVILNIHRKSDIFLQVMRDPVLVEMAKAVQRSKVVGLNSQFLFKKAGTAYAKQAWSPHQDSAYIDAQHGTYLQLHISLVNSDQENGGFYYYAGSHKEGILPFQYAKSWKEDFDDKGVSHPGWGVKVPPQYERVDISNSRGGIILQHGHVVHGSYPNFSPTRSRYQYSMAYMNQGAPFFEGRTSVKIPVAVE